MTFARLSNRPRVRTRAIGRECACRQKQNTKQWPASDRRIVLSVHYFRLASFDLKSLRNGSNVVLASSDAFQKKKSKSDRASYRDNWSCYRTHQRIQYEISCVFAEPKIDANAAKRANKSHTNSIRISSVLFALLWARMRAYRKREFRAHIQFPF